MSHESHSHRFAFRDTDRIETDVRLALERERRIEHPELITVSADEIGTVVLRGAVSTPRQRHAAAHDAREVDGVFDVIADDLKVHPPFGNLRDDDEIRAAVIQRLNSDPRIRSTHIHVSVARGRVKLTGYVREVSEQLAAGEDAASISGGISVVNQLKVR